MKNRIVLLVLIIPIVLVLSLVTAKSNFKKWTYNLPNHYVVGRIDEDSIIIGKYVNNKLSFKRKDKKIGISEYVESFGYDDKYIFARTLNNENGLTVNYYIIDSLEEKIYGSYELEAFLAKVKELNLNTDINWIQSTTYDK